MALRVLDRGRGDPVLLLHGFTGSARAWPPVCVEALAARHRVLIPDLPGHGGSPVPRDGSGCDFGATVEALVRLLDRAGMGPATWIGYSMGGRVALGAAVLRPGSVSRLVLESASPGLRTEEERTERRAADEALAARIEADGVPAFVDRWMGLPLFATQRRLPPARLAEERRRRLENRTEGLAASLRGLGTGAQPSFWDDLAGVSVPALLVTGVLDAKFTELAGAMAGLMPTARHVTTPGAGHAVHLERPGDWLQAVIGFLG